MAKTADVAAAGAEVALAAAAAAAATVETVAVAAAETVATVAAIAMAMAEGPDQREHHAPLITTSQKCRATYPVVCRSQKRYNFF